MKKPISIFTFVCLILTISFVIQWNCHTRAEDANGATIRQEPETGNTNSGLPEMLSRLMSAEPADYDSLIDEIIQQSPSTSEVAVKIASAAPVPNEERQQNLVPGWSAGQATDEAGSTRPYHMYLPQSVIDGKLPVAIIVYLHGGVRRPDFGQGPGSRNAIGYGSLLWPKVADVQNFVVVCPLGREECAWWTDNGVSHIRAVLRDVRRMIDVPDRSIFCTGFSDGGSGCYYLAMVSPDPFAGFIAMNGHPAVASGVSDTQIYLRNMFNTPLIAVMTQEDMLYPSRIVLPHIAAAINAGAPIHLISYPNINHQPLYFSDQATTFANFIKNTKRTYERRVRWLTADANAGQVQLVDILELGERENDADPIADINFKASPGRVLLGVQLSNTPETEVRFLGVADGSAADKAGIEAGDVLLKFDDQETPNAGSFRNVMRTKRFGDSFTAAVKRGDEVLEVSGAFPKFVPRPAYRRDKPTSYVEVQFGEREIGVLSRGIRKMKVWLPNEWADMTEISVKQNGTVRKLPVERLTPKELLTRFANSADRTNVNYAFVTID